MSLIHLSYQTPQFNLAYLKHTQTLTSAYRGGKIIQHKAYFIIKRWISHVTYWILYWKWKQNGCVGSGWFSVYQLFTLVIVWLTGSCGSLPCPASQERIILQMVNPIKDLNSKFKVWFLRNAYCFYIIIMTSKKLTSTFVSWGTSVPNTSTEITG